MMKEWVFGTGRICPCSPSRRAISSDRGQTEQSPAGDGQLTYPGFDGEMPDALIKLMLFVDFLCMDASIVACQRVVSHAS